MKVEFALKISTISYSLIPRHDTLQLITSSGDSRSLLSGLRSDLLVTRPVQSLQSLSEDRMRKVIAGEHPVSVHGAEVLDLKLNKRLGQLRLVAKVACKGVSLELELAAEDVHQKLDQCVHGAQNVREEDEANNDGMFRDETKVPVQRAVVDED